MERVEAAHRDDVSVERGFAFITNAANWSSFWPGYVRLAEDSSWAASGDTARLVTRLFGRERELTMTIRAFEPNRLVTYTSTQPGLPDAHHERHFEPDGDGFVYRLVVEFEPRGGIAGFSTICSSHAGSGARSSTRSQRWSTSWRVGRDERGSARPRHRRWDRWPRDRPGAPRTPNRVRGHRAGSGLVAPGCGDVSTCPARPPQRRRAIGGKLEPQTPPARPGAYLERKRAKGKSRRDALRCLKRLLVRAVFNTLKASPALT